jgi:hypothetical protein
MVYMQTKSIDREMPIGDSKFGEAKTAITIVFIKNITLKTLKIIFNI